MVIKIEKGLMSVCLCNYLHILITYVKQKLCNITITKGSCSLVKFKCHSFVTE